MSATTADGPRIRPLDEHNRALLSHVHPADWRNPEPKDRYHVVVIGGGTGGLVTAAAAAGLGATVALVERDLMGGDCLNVGCVPSKALIRAARAWHDARTAARFGGPEGVGEGDFGAVMERMRRIRARIAPVDGAPRFASLGVDVFLGDARFTGRDTVDVAGAELRFKRAVIATGGRASIPPIPGLAEAHPLTNETVFELTERPDALVVIGAGPIGCELAQAFARFGSRVTLLDAEPTILPREDADAAGIVADALRRDGVDIRIGARIERVEVQDGDHAGGPGHEPRPSTGAAAHPTSKRVTFSDDDGTHTIVADRILVAAGRTPNIENLGLDAAGVSAGKRGVVVDDRLRTSNPRIYAVGDVCSQYQFTHTADWNARSVVQNALFFGRSRTSRYVVPWTTYTSPEIAHVGMYESDAHEKGLEVDTLTIPLDEMDRALLDGQEDGFLRLHVKKDSDRILGATLVADHAGEMISELTLAMTNGLGLSAIGRTIHPYPTQAEIFRKAADQWRRGKLTPFVRRLFGWYFRFF